MATGMTSIRLARRIVFRNRVGCGLRHLSSPPPPPPPSWLDKSTTIPASWKPFLHLARADKQVGTLLLLWPCCWSTALAAPLGSLPDVLLMGKFAVGALVMRGAGCTINDMWDRDFDKHVERTKNRPIASGAVTMPQAFAFLGAQLSCGLGVLLSLDQSCLMLGMASMPLVVAYPLMKRLTNWPQLVLGLTFNWGALVGWSAVHGSLTADAGLAAVLPLYAAGVCWTLVYDTLYGYQDRVDDRKLGLRSTSLHLGDEPQWALTGIASGMLGGLSLSGLAVGLSPVYYCGVAGVGAQLLWQIWTADTSAKSPGNLWRRFDSNKYVGGALTAAIVAGHF